MRTRERSILAAVTAALVCAPAVGAEPSVKLVLAQSEIVFSVKQMGAPVEGRFKRFDAQVVFDPKRPEDGTVAIDIDMASATMGIAEADAELAKPAWFGTAKFPRATFRSTSIKALGAGRFDVAGRLAIKASEREVVVPMTIAPPAHAGAASLASGSFTVDRLAFRVGENEWADASIVADKVYVRFKLSLFGLAPN